MDREQVEGKVAQAKHVADGPLAFAIHNMIWDETELDVKLDEWGAGSFRILASHSQWTLSPAVGEPLQDFDLIQGFNAEILHRRRPPYQMCAMGSLSTPLY